MVNRHLSDRTLTWLLLLLALGLRLAVSGQFLLAPDEANYWQWSRHPALGYHDHPPMIAWTIGLATTLFGHTEWAVRLPTVLGLTVASGFLCLLAARWFSWRVALHTGLVSQLLLLTNGSALIATPDGLLLPCWAAACYHGAQAVETDKRGHWLATGLWFGFGLLSKYTMLLFPASLCLTVLVSAKYRQRLLAPWPWLGLLIGLLLFTPVLVWNAQHDWATFRHVLYQGGAGSRTFFTLRFVGDYFASQAALLTPVVFLLILAAWFHPGLWRRLKNGRAAMLVGLSLPGFLVFLLLSLHVRIYGNWPAPVYLPALVLVAALFSSRSGDDRLPGVWKAALITAAAITLPVIVQVVYPVLPLPLRIDRTARECAGWDELGAKVGAAAAVMERPGRTFLFGLRYQYASELAFYTPGRPRTVSINRWTRPNVYDYWFEDHQLLGWDGVGILEDPATAAAVSTLFARSLPVEKITLHRDSPWFGHQAVQTLYLFRGFGFRGGLRWQPVDDGDIRAGRGQIGPGRQQGGQ
jgi:undecaprenyl-diphosphatase